MRREARTCLIAMGRIHAYYFEEQPLRAARAALDHVMHTRTFPFFATALAAVLILSLPVVGPARAASREAAPVLAVSPVGPQSAAPTMPAAPDAPAAPRPPQDPGAAAATGAMNGSSLYDAIFGASAAANATEDDEAGEACELVMGQGVYNWVDGTVRVRRNACPPEGDVLDPARVQRLAVRGAARDARRELYDAISALPLDGRRTVGDALTDEDERIHRLQGLLQNSQLSVEDADSGVDVIVSVSLRGEVGMLIYPPTVPFLSGIAPRMPGVEFQYDALAGLPGQLGSSAIGAEEVEKLPSLKSGNPLGIGSPAAPPAPASPASPTPPAPPSAPVVVQASPRPSVASESGITGLIVDARGMDVKPVLLPVLFSEDGSGVYGSYLVGRENVVDNGMAVYVHRPDARAAVRRAGRRSVTVKALRAPYKGSGELVLGRADAAKARAALTRSVLERCAVVIVVD